jgi:hypothetical protein
MKAISSAICEAATKRRLERSALMLHWMALKIQWVFGSFLSLGGRPLTSSSSSYTLACTLAATLRRMILK